MRIYIPNISNTEIGGGFTFLNNFRKALEGRVEFVDNWKDCDIIFVFGITTMDKGEVYAALNAGKKLVLRVDNIPRKSRNRRQSPAERLKEFGEKASLVVYQSEWCKKYAGFFAGEGIIINNGVDSSIFNTNGRKSDGNTCLYINYNDNPNKRFDEAIYLFEMACRKKPRNLIIAGVAPKIYLENPEYNWDLNIPVKVEYAGIIKKPSEVANLMKRCDYILYPSFAEAYPNTLLEALACGLEPIGLNPIGGSIEAYRNSIDPLTNMVKVKTIQEMGDEYIKAFEKII